MAYKTAFAALADPTRREVFEQLRKGPSSVGEIARHLPVSRPAVSQHLKVLKEAGLVQDEPKGTARIYRIDPKGLAAIRAWLDNNRRDKRPPHVYDLETYGLTEDILKRDFALYRAKYLA